VSLGLVIAGAFAGASSLAGPDSASPWAFELCRVLHGRRECVGWSKDCSRGEDSAGGHDSKKRSCAKLGTQECAALGKLVRGVIEDSRGLPGEDRTVNAAEWLSCEGFIAREGGNWVAACLGRHPGGRELLSSAFRGALEVCDARP